MGIESMTAASTHVAPNSVWNPAVDDTLVCINIRQETHDVKSFTFASPKGKTFSFRAGQYFLFDFEIEGQTESRCYSISSSPHRRNAFTITTKRVPGGIISNWLHDNFAVGTRIKANGPLGHFVRPAGRKYLLISGGSGITPVMSMVRELADSHEPTDVAFLHAARTPKDLIFREELSHAAGRIGNLRLHFLPETVEGEPSWPGLAGRISAEYLRLAVPDVA